MSTSLSSSVAAEALDLVERLGEEMARRWRAGDRPTSEEFFARHPELLEQPTAALELIAEELALRQEHAEPTDVSDLQRRFPRWRRQVQVLARCHQLLAPCRLPAVGETLGEFRMLAELGRGAQGRAYLARQSSLADRPVVLKLSADGGEHLSLARLQHTHIVPLYSVHDFPSHGLHGLCLPYLGGASLAALLDRLRDRPPAQRTGRDMVATLGHLSKTPVAGPACRFLEGASYVRAVAWIGTCLADALHYAHERDLVHFDVKPSNVLLAADGQPMLLDFHLARAALPTGAAAPSLLGGTPGYMAPEHQAALVAVRERGVLPQSVDGRADVYALGVVLYEMLAGTVPGSVAALRQCNPQVPTGLADIVAKCLAADPERRYPSAAALASDLRRFLADLPLRGVRNRSLLESWRRWRRRRPYALPLMGLLLIVLTAGAGLAQHRHRQIEKARDALQQGEQLLSAGRSAEALGRFRAGVALAEDLPFSEALTKQLRDGADQAKRAQAVEELHHACEQLRTFDTADAPAEERARTVEAVCARLWRNRAEIVQRLEAGEQVRQDLLDVAILWSDLRLGLASADRRPQIREDALVVLDQAEALLGPSCVLREERRTHLRALGRPLPVEDGTSPEPRDAWEHFAVGRACFRAGDVARADEAMDRALALRPELFGANYYKGRCAVEQGRFDEAVAAFSACVALAPKNAAGFYYRGVAHQAQGHFQQAWHDYARAFSLDPSVARPRVGLQTGIR